jgi:hypothetical protein
MISTIIETNFIRTWYIMPVTSKLKLFFNDLCYFFQMHILKLFKINKLKSIITEVKSVISTFLSFKI